MISAFICTYLVTMGGSVPASLHAAEATIAGESDVNVKLGAEVFHRICQGCHMSDAKGAIGAGKYPALAGNASLASKEFVVITLLLGRRNMPAFGGNGEVGLFFKLPTLTDAQIAAVTNYVRTNFGNQFPGNVTAAEVKMERLNLNLQEAP